MADDSLSPQICKQRNKDFCWVKIESVEERLEDTKEAPNNTLGHSYQTLSVGPLDKRAIVVLVGIRHKYSLYRKGEMSWRPRTWSAEYEMLGAATESNITPTRLLLE